MCHEIPRFDMRWGDTPAVLCEECARHREEKGWENKEGKERERVRKSERQKCRSTKRVWEGMAREIHEALYYELN